MYPLCAPVHALIDDCGIDAFSRTKGRAWQRRSRAGDSIEGSRYAVSYHDDHAVSPSRSSPAGELEQARVGIDTSKARRAR